MFHVIQKAYYTNIFLYIVDSGWSVAILFVLLFACRGCLLVSESFFHDNPFNFVHMSGGVVSELEPHIMFLLEFAFNLLSVFN